MDFQNVSGCLIPFLVTELIAIAGSIGALVYIGIKSQTQPDDINTFFGDYILDGVDTDDMNHIITIAIILIILLTIESIYSWIVIFSLYQETTALNHKVQDSVFLDNYPHHPNLSINNYPSNMNPVFGNYPPSTEMIMTKYPTNLNLGINSYPSNPQQNHGPHAPDGLAFNYN